MSEPLQAVGKNKHLCVHGHFYQPPRENPWTGGVDPEESARPYLNWNARIVSECYGPNAAGPVLNPDGRIVDVADNFARISFNFGPTLLAWLEREQPALYARIISNPSNAMAQPYYHAILPLCTPYERRLLLRWGLDDFKRRFGRDAEGLWLPETAADTATLEDLVATGLKFTVLHPRQAARVRAAGSEWKEVGPRALMPTRPYTWVSKKTPGASLTLFFFHELLHESVISGEAFASPDALFKKLYGRTHPDESTQLLFVAADGEFFGHHHKGGAAALAQTLFLSEAAGFSLTTPGRFAGLYPPPEEVEIVEGGSWSCEHGLGRWKEDCGCKTPRLKSWSQAWRGPLREALNWLAVELDRVYDAQAGAFFKDYKHARRRMFADDAETHFARERLPALPAAEEHKARALLEMMRRRYAMFTSCGWFFDEISGIETAHVLKEAARAVEIAESFGAVLTEEFKKRLSACPSNVKTWENGKGVYEKLVLPCKVDHERMAAHYAILTHLRPGLASVPSGWKIEAAVAARAKRLGAAGRDRALTAQRLTVTNTVTGDTKNFLALTHQRDRLDLTCRVAHGGGDAAALFGAFENESDDQFERTISASFGAAFHTLEALLPADRAEALRWLTPDPVGGRPKREFLDMWVAAVARLRSGTDEEEIPDLLRRSRKVGILPDQLPWVDSARRGLDASLEGLLSGADERALARFGRWLAAFEDAKLHIELWKLQELFWRWRAKLNDGGSAAERRLAAALGEKLGFAAAALPLG